MSSDRTGKPGRNRPAVPGPSASLNGMSVVQNRTNGPYVLKRSRRKTLSLIIRPDGLLEVRCPLRLQTERIDAFIEQKADWIRRKQETISRLVAIPSPGPSDFGDLSRRTQALLERLLVRYPFFKPSGIKVVRQRKRWGSCNNKGQIRINACLSLLPEPLAEYVLVHELCHLVHLNHSAKFHALLMQMLPDARDRQQALYRYRILETTPEG